MKKSFRRQVPCAAAILSGGLLFTGSADAVTLFSEDFEAGSGANPFLMPTYAYSLNYTQPNIFPPAGGGTAYGFGGPGTVVPFPAAGPLNVSLLSGGITAVDIDSGNINFLLYGQFSTYLGQQDFAEVSVAFLDGASAPIGSAVLIGSVGFVTALPQSPNARFADARDWGEDLLNGLVPVGARSINITITENRVSGGTVIDGYIDNVRFEANPIPEPGTLTLSGLAALALARRNRKR